MRNTPAARIALGGMLAALAVVIMNLVGMIPVATFVCPMLCMMILTLVLRFCGKRIGWAWYGAVAILCALMAPDKEDVEGIKKYIEKYKAGLLAQKNAVKSI